MSAIRFSGMASGMDTESMVKELMKAERVRVDKFEQENIYKTWQQDAYNTINKDTADFILKTKSELGMATTTSTGMTLDTLNLSWMKTTTSSNESAFTVSPLSTAINSSHTMKVNQLAKGVNIVGNEVVAQGETTLQRLGVGAAGTIDFTVGGVSKSVSYAETDDINKIITDLNTEMGGSVASLVDGQLKLDFANASGAVNFTSDSGNVLTGSSSALKTNLSTGTDYTALQSGSNIRVNGGATIADLGVADGSIEFEKADGSKVSVSYLSTDTIDSFLKKINSSDAGIKASLDSSTGRVFMTTDTTGADAKIKVSADANGLLTGAASKLNTDLTLNDDTKVGQDAEVVLDGATLNFSSNQFDVNGMSFNIKSVTATEETVNIGTNTDEIVNRLKTFVADYNKLVDGMQKKLSEKTYRDYKPLTKEQREAMSDEEIKLWEEKAKSGLMRSDDLVERMLNRTRSGLYEGTTLDSGAEGFLHEIGITTLDKTGKLTIDEDKLRTAISQDPDKVVDILYKRPDDSITDEDEKRANTGALYRMVDDMVDGMKEIITKAGTGSNKELYRNVKSTILLDFVKTGSQSLLDKDISSIKSRIDRENRRLSDVENRYWKQFTAMEKAISQMNQQSSWIGSQMMG